MHQKKHVPEEKELYGEQILELKKKEKMISNQFFGRSVHHFLQ